MLDFFVLVLLVFIVVLLVWRSYFLFVFSRVRGYYLLRVCYVLDIVGVLFIFLVLLGFFEIGIRFYFWRRKRGIGRIVI